MHAQASADVVGSMQQTNMMQHLHLLSARQSPPVALPLATLPALDTTAPDTSFYLPSQPGQFLGIDPPDNFDPFTLADTIDQPATVLPSNVVMQHFPAASPLLLPELHSPHVPRSRADFLSSPQLDQLLEPEQLLWPQSAVPAGSPIST